ncbi:hypothetical protein HNW13_018535 [Shewanella sp. BF02_Schw]|uniref:hypothetical protein n=1 Tax=Shewanella sp. BF02_Schw TaxID=394908 RepID=UPI00177AE670|nr:hypothetical protein [Shewanella sp. BF02_Schw]MBO1897739.1 hypothetical protein [Shewanella sp. BF02_Schw]
MTNSLSVNAAKELIDFINNTNYQLAPFCDGAFSSKSEAIAYVEGAEYNSEEPLSICFNTRQGNYWDSAQVTFSDSEWFIEDQAMGGKWSKGESIQKAIEAFRLLHNPTCNYYPDELIFNAHLFQ